MFVVVHQDVIDIAAFHHLVQPERGLDGRALFQTDAEAVSDRTEIPVDVLGMHAARKKGRGEEEERSVRHVCAVCRCR